MGTTSFWGRLLPRRDHLSHAEAQAVIKASSGGAMSVKQELERMWNALQLLSDSKGDARDGDIERYRQSLEAIDAAVSRADYNGLSLIDGTGYRLDLRSGWRGQWQRKIDHTCLLSGERGLGLIDATALRNGANMEDANEKAKEAIEKVDSVIDNLEADERTVASVDEAPAAADVGDGEEGSAFKEIAQIVLIALIIAMVVRSLFFQFFNIPSGSMKSTLLIGDFVFVSKFAYGYSHKSFPLGIDFFEGRVFEGVPKRGDVVVFKQTADGRTDYIKRVVGLPGDVVQMKDGVLFIDDVEVAKEPLGMFLDSDPRNGRPDQKIPSYRETLPGGASHLTLDEVGNGSVDNTKAFQVPDGHYFVMGDNRDNSADSRFVDGAVTFVPAENLVGRAELIFFSVDGTAKFWEVWKWPSAIRYERLFKKIE